MLSYFSVKNFKNFKEEFVFDLSDASSYEFNNECVCNGVVNKAIIYGHNGVGKTNLGLAIFDIVLHLTDKYKALQHYSNYSNAECEDELSKFNFRFKFNNDDILEYSYGKKAPEELVYERLVINDRTVVSYDRTKESVASIELEGAETLQKDLSQITISILKYIKNNTVLIKNKTNDILSDFYSFIDRMLLFWSLDTRNFQGYEPTGGTDILKDILERGNLEDFQKFLNKAEIECALQAIDVNGTKRIVFNFGKNSIDFWAVASAGTRSLTLFYYWMERLKDEANTPSLLFIDEFDAFYHQPLSESIVAELKKNKCQVILTTHNTGLMSNDLLRPDCYFLMFKDRIRPLSRLIDKEIRYAHNIEKMYRAGAFHE